MADRGAAVAVADVNDDGASEVVDAIRDAGGHAAAVDLDVTSIVSVRAGLATIEGEFGAVDILVNNVGGTSSCRSGVAS